MAGISRYHSGILVFLPFKIDGFKHMNFIQKMNKEKYERKNKSAQTDSI